MSRIYCHYLTSPCGSLLLCEYDKRLCLCNWVNDTSVPPSEYAGVAYILKLQPVFILESTAFLAEVERQLTAYFRGELTEFSVPLYVAGTYFRVSVWNALRTIPYGETISYATLALRIGRSNAFRAVGQACHTNPISIILPCHRVIGSTGMLTGYGGGLRIKEYLLALERQYKAN